MINKMRIISLFLPVLLIGAMIGCNDTNGGDPDIYIAGAFVTTMSSIMIPDFKNYPCYWFNGDRIDLGGGVALGLGWANGIFVDEGNVHVAGTIVIENNNQLLDVPCYWLNGTPLELPRPAGNNQYGGKGKEIFVFAGNVFISGYCREYDSPTAHVYSRACFWRNGVRFELDAPAAHDSETQGIFVHFGDLYVAGFCGTNPSYNFIADMPCYWKNEQLIQLPVLPGSLKGRAFGIKVIGNNVYVSGTCSDYNDKNKRACYWHNGTVYQLPVPPYGPSSEGCGIAVEENFIYIAGGAGFSPQYEMTPGYWTIDKANSAQTVWTRLPNLSCSPSMSHCDGGMAFAVAKTGDDIYVCGKSDWGNSSGRPILWTNGELAELSIPEPLNLFGIKKEMMANSIFIVD